MHVAPLGIQPSSFNDLIEGGSSFNPIMSEGETILPLQYIRFTSIMVFRLSREDHSPSWSSFLDLDRTFLSRTYSVTFVTSITSPRGSHYRVRLLFSFTEDIVYSGYTE